MAEGACFSLQDISDCFSLIQFNGNIVYLLVSLLWQYVSWACNQNKDNRKSKKKSPRVTHMGETLYAVSRTMYQKESIKVLKMTLLAIRTLQQFEWFICPTDWIFYLIYIHCLNVTWCSCGSLTRPAEDCLNQADVSFFSPQLTGEGTQSNPVKSALLWRLLDTLHRMEMIHKAPQWAQQWYFREQPHHGTTVDSYIYLGGHTHKNLDWSKKNPSWVLQDQYFLVSDLYALVC